MVNEKRLIDANALSEAVNGIGKDIKRTRAVELACLVLIADAPTVDAVEVAHGRCKKSENREEWYTYEYTCLECGATMMVSDVDNYDIAPNYCANCGAKMDGGGDNG